MPDISSGNVTDLSSQASAQAKQQKGFLSRAAEATRYVISGVTPNGWFGPWQPLQPMAPIADVRGRQFDYQTGINLNYTPRAYEGVSYEELRALADNCDVLRSVIETRKDQMEALDWTIKIKPDSSNPRARATPEQQARIDAITKFFQYPDKRHNFQQWLRMWMEDMFVLDAATMYKRRDKLGRLWALEPIDGATIKVLIDDSGRSPLPPDPAYQQILHGIPAADYSMPYDSEEPETRTEEFTSDELLYLVRNPRTNKLTGYSPVQQVLITVNISIRRTLFQLEYYREGSMPDAFLMAPADWKIDQVRGFQDYIDGLLSGNLAERRKLRVLPNSTVHETKKMDLKDDYDEWLARIICYVFSVPPTPFIKANNRATAENQHEAALEEGLAPLQKYVKHTLNRIIATDFESTDLSFDWIDDREQDAQTMSNILVAEVKGGIISIDEARESKGLDPLGGAYAVPMALVGTGFVAPTSPETQAAEAMNDQANNATEAGNAEDDASNIKVPDESPRDVQEAEGKVVKLMTKAAIKKKFGGQNPYLLSAHQH